VTWYWAALIALAAWLTPFLMLGAVGAWVTHRRHKTTRRHRRSIYDWSTELDERDVELWCRQLVASTSEQIAHHACHDKRLNR